MLTKNMSLVVTRIAGPKSIKELIEQAKARPGKMNMGAGTITSRLGAVLFAKTAGIDVQLIPFKGSAEIGQAVLAGTVDFALDSTGTALPLVQGGQYRALAKYTNQPLPMFPGVPSLSEAAGLAVDRRKLDLDRGRGAGRHAASDRREDPERGRQDLWRQADHASGSRRSASTPSIRPRPSSSRSSAARAPAGRRCSRKMPIC